MKAAARRAGLSGAQHSLRALAGCMDHGWSNADLPEYSLLPVDGRAWGTMESRTPGLVAMLVRRQGQLG